MYYKDMEVWKVAIDLVTEIYKETSSYPEKEKYCIAIWKTLEDRKEILTFAVEFV